MAEGNIEVTVTWAPADGVRMLLERAASMLTGYGELIRRDGASHVEEHHYLPEVEHVAAELLALMNVTPRTCGQIGISAEALGAMHADAERYRWLRGNYNETLDLVQALQLFTPEGLDAAIDAAREEE